MKLKNIRRLGVLILALAMMLSLATPGLAAGAGRGEAASPRTVASARAASESETSGSETVASPEAPDNTEFRILVDNAIKNGVTVDVKIGDKLNLGNQWNPKEPDTCTYEWRVTDLHGYEPRGVSWRLDSSDKNGRKLIVNVLSTDDEGVIITSIARSLLSGKTYTASCTLKIAPLQLRIADTDNFEVKNPLQMKIGDSADLTVGWTYQKDPPEKLKIRFEWETGVKTDAVQLNSSPVTITTATAGETKQTKLEVKALKATTEPVEVAVKAYWIPEGEMANLGPQLLDTYTFRVEVADSGLRIKGPSGNRLLVGGVSATFKAEWDGVTEPKDVEYSWSYLVDGAEAPSAVFTLSSKTGQEVTLTTKNIVTKGEIACTVTLENGAKITEKYPLDIIMPELSVTDEDGKEVTDGYTLTFGKTVTFTVKADPDPTDAGIKTVKSSWTDSDIKFGSSSKESTTVTVIKMPADGKTTLKVKVTLGSSTSSPAVEKELTLKVEKPSVSIKADKTTLRIGELAALEAVLPEGVSSSNLSYKWEFDTEAISVSSKSSPQITVRAVNSTKDMPDTVNVTLTVTSSDGALIGSASSKLTIVKPKLTVTAGGVTVASAQELTAKLDQEIKLEAAWLPGTEPLFSETGEGTYKWSWSASPDGIVSFDPDDGEQTTVTIKKDPGGGSVTVTVKLDWKGQTNAGGAVSSEVTYDIKIDVAGPKLSITSTDGEIVYDEEHPLGLREGAAAELKAQLVDGPEGNKGVTYKWEVVEITAEDGGKAVDDEEAEGGGEAQDTEKAVSLSPRDAETTTVTANKATTGKKVTITVTASWGSTDSDKGSKEASCSVTVFVPVTGVTLDQTTLTLPLDSDPVKLTATVSPGNARQDVTWSTSNPSVVTVKDGVVTPVGQGEATITVTTVDGGKTATCTVTVTAPTAPAVKGLTFGRDSIVRSKSDPEVWDLAVVLLPAGAQMEEGGYIDWTITLEEGADPNGLEIVSANGLTLTLKSKTPGNYKVTATYKSAKGDVGSDSIYVEISGITLTRMSAKLLVGQNLTIALDGVYGFANDGTGTSNVEWNSSDPAIVSVMGGELTGWKLGKAVITATRNGYTAECEVEVTEDGEVIAGPYKATTGNPLVLGDGPVYQVYTDLNKIAKNKTGDRDAKGDPVGNGSPLSYITNVSVPTKQGTLYYNYDSGANTGEGVGITDRFALKADGAVRSLNLLYFVPKQGFKGTAEITFTGWAGSSSFSGVIRVEVEGADTSISYRTQSGVPVYFLTDDFDAFCRSQTSRGVNYITFDLPRANQGVLYYNYMAGEGIRVSASTRFSQTGRYTIGDVCFVPNASFAGVATIPFHGVDSAGMAFSGSVMVNVISAGGDSTGVYLSGEQGDLITLQASLLNDICKDTINDTLAFVTFKLPAMDKGMLYYNYRGAGDFDSRVNATTRYFFSGVPGISNITFVPAPNVMGQIAISYTGYGTSGASFDGTLYIDLGGVNPIYYFAAKYNSATFDRNDFSSAGARQNVNVSYVIFTGISDASLGDLYYNRTGSSKTKITPSPSSTARYYVNPTSSQSGLSRVSFLAKDLAGNVTITYSAYDSSGKLLFDSSVVIQVGTLTPMDTDVSCTTGGRAWLSATALSRACSPALSTTLSYVEITSVPNPATGRLYFNYSGFGTGTAVQPGDRFYYSGSPNISQLSFIPHAGFTGEAEITYIGYSGDEQEQVSGRVMVDVTSAKTSVFNDMGNYKWAIDSVEFLRQNGTVKGVGSNNYSPGGSITRGDFILMLVRAYGFTASGGASYQDVPADSYYAEAIRIATALGIVQGYNGYFNPKSSLSRQDAMVMIFNSLKSSGMAITNGLTADFNAYYDGGQVASYAREAVGSLLRMSVVKGDGNGYLRPQGQLNRAEAAMLMHTIMTL